LPIRFILGPGQQNDMAPACDLIRGIPADKVLADRAYDADSLHDLIYEQGGEPDSISSITITGMGMSFASSCACSSRCLALRRVSCLPIPAGLKTASLARSMSQGG